MVKNKFSRKEGFQQQQHSRNSSRKTGGFKGHQRKNPFRKQGDEATPWLKLKEAFLEQEAELQKQKEQNNKERESVLQARAQNHKEFLIKEKQKEETTWERFSSDSEDSSPEDDNVLRAGIRHKWSNDAEKFEATATKKQDLNNKGMSSLSEKKIKMAITKCTAKAQGTSFFDALQDLKYRGVK